MARESVNADGPCGTLAAFCKSLGEPDCAALKRAVAIDST
jgi:hypothetical protein